MSDYPTQLADLLERVTARARELTSGRISKVTDRTSAGIVALTLGIAALSLVLFALYGVLDFWLGPAGAFAVLGLLTLGGGLILWRKRNIK